MAAVVPAWFIGWLWWWCSRGPEARLGGSASLGLESASRSALACRGEKRAGCRGRAPSVQRQALCGAVGVVNPWVMSRVNSVGRGRPGPFWPPGRPAVSWKETSEGGRWHSTSPQRPRPWPVAYAGQQPQRPSQAFIPPYQMSWGDGGRWGPWGRARALIRLTFCRPRPRPLSNRRWPPPPNEPAPVRPRGPEKPAPCPKAERPSSLHAPPRPIRAH